MNAVSSSAAIRRELYSSGPSGMRIKVLFAFTKASTSEEAVTDVGAMCGSGSSVKYLFTARTVLVLPTPGCATKNTYKFGYNGDDVCNHTFCSNVAAILPIAAHFLNISGDSKFVVASTNDSIKEGHLRAALPLVPAFVVFESVRVRLSIIISLVPPCFAIVGDGESSAFGEGDFNSVLFQQVWDNL